MSTYSLDVNYGMSMQAELAAEARLVAGMDLEDEANAEDAEAQLRAAEIASEEAEATTVTNPSMFVLAGNATFTVVSKKTGARFTYRVRAPKLNRNGEPVSKEAAEVRFVSVLTGPQNTTDYQFMGTIFVKDQKFVHSKKSNISADAPSAKAFAWSFANKFPSDKMEVHHAGTCGRCGRKLTVPESIRTGLGPECAGKVGC